MEHVEAGGARIPKLGLGTWQHTGEACTETVRTALDAGYRHVDTAQVYDNEAAVGAGIERADVDREDVFLTTKVWRSNLRAEDLRDSVEASLDRLGVDYVDLLLVHWPHLRVPAEEPLGEMARLREEGLIEHVGVSNYTRSQLAAAMAVSEAPVVTDQVLYHPYKDQSDLREFCVEEGASLTAYSPLARGRALDDEVLADIGAGYDTSAAQVALRWLVQQEGVIAIPKTTSEQHLRENLAVFDFALTDAEMERVHDLSPGVGQRLRNALPGLMRKLPV